jgi:hypothetical protein
MGVSYEYETSVGEMIKQLQRISNKYGKETTLTLPNPGFYDPNFEGRNSCLTAIFSNEKGHAIIVERNIK